MRQAQLASASMEKNTRGNAIGPHLTQWFTLNVFFQVSLRATPATQAPAHYAQYQRQLAALPAIPVTVSVPDNHRVIQQFLKKALWLEHVEGLPAALIVQLYALDPRDRLFPALLKHVERYLLDSQNKINNYYFQRVIGQRPKTE